LRPYARPIFICDGSDRLLCPIPLKINTYRGCGGSCLYCAAAGNMSRWESRAQGTFTDIAPSSTRYIEKMFYRHNGRMEGALISQRYPVQIGHMSDPLQPREKVHEVTLKVLRVLQDREYPCIITSKFPDLLTEPEYLRAIEGLPLAIQCSISSADPAMLRILEPNAPPWQERIEALRTLHEAGVHVILRLWPYIPDLCGDLMPLLQAAKSAGVRTIQANFLKLYNSGNNRGLFHQALGYDLPERSRMTWEYRGNYQIARLEDQRREIVKLEELCHGLGIRVLTCDDLTGNRAWRDCCGVGDLPGFKVAPWAYQVRGHVITSHTDFETYMQGLRCPWHAEFEAEWNKGTFADAIHNLQFHEDDKSYSKIKINQGE
jgi:DNA repair photolyase